MVTIARRSLGATALGFVVACVGIAARAAPAGTTRASVIAFVSRSNPDADGHVWEMRPDGTHMRRLAAGLWPSFSSDGKLIVYSGTNADLRLMDADGAHRRTIFPGPDLYYTPHLSPDVAEVVYGYSCCHVPDQIMVSPLSGRGGTSDLGSCQQQCNNDDPVFSPSGRQIVFDSDRRGVRQLFVMDADGTHVRQLTHLHRGASQPAFSPGGRRIVFVSGGQVWLMNAGGSGARRLIHDRLLDSGPVFSPGGGRVAFAAAPSAFANAQIYVARADGTHEHRVTHDRLDDSQPSWGVG